MAITSGSGEPGLARKYSVRGSACARLVVLLGMLLLGGAPLASAQTEGDDPQVAIAGTLAGDMPLPANGRVVGLTFMGADSVAVLLDISDPASVTDERRVQLVIQGRSGGIWRKLDFSGVLDRGLAWDGRYLWSCGDVADGGSALYKIGVDSTRVWQVQEAYETPGHRPSDLCFDGRFIWISDRDSGRIDRFDPEVEEITRSALTPGFSPVGLAWDGNSMWLSDAGTGRLYRLSGSRRTWSATVDEASFLHRGQEVLLAGSGGQLWLVLAGESRAQRMALR